MEYWNAFGELPYSDAVLIGVGALVALIAAVRILQSSLKLLFWVVLGAVGLAAVAHGAGRAPWEPGLDGAALADLLEPGREVSRDVRQRMCVRLEEVCGD